MLNDKRIYNKPVKIRWKVVAGPPKFKLSFIQSYDIVFDQFDYKIRGLEIPPYLASRRPPQGPQEVTGALF